MGKTKINDYEYVKICRTVTLPDGQKKKKQFYGKNKREAEKKFKEYMLNVEKDSEKRTYIKFKDVAERWLEIKGQSVSDVTYNGYKYKVNHLIEAFGNKGIASITASEIKLYLAACSNESINTVKKRRGYLQSIFELALDDGYISHNPVTKIDLPKCKAQKITQPYDKHAARIVLDAAKSQGLNGLSAFIPLKTGMRPGEVMAFNPPRDLDPDKKLLTIRESIKYKNGHQIVGLPKYDSVRTIPVDDEFIDHILSFSSSGYIFANRFGSDRPMNYFKWYSHRFNPFMESLPDNIVRLNPHALRHTYGTLLYESGTDLYTIMSVMGHKDVKVTQIYVHQRTEAIQGKWKLNF